jgi:hypothetical protein
VENSQQWRKGTTNLDLIATAFKNSPTVFETALASNLKAFSGNQHGYTLLQEVDDLLLAGPTQDDFMKGTHHLLSLLWEAEYKISRKKAHICQNIVKYLGFQLSQGQHRLGASRLYVLSQPLKPAVKL